MLLQTTYLADRGPNLQKSAKIFDELPFLPFSLSHLALPELNHLRTLVGNIDMLLSTVLFNFLESSY